MELNPKPQLPNKEIWEIFDSESFNFYRNSRQKEYTFYSILIYLSGNLDQRTEIMTTTSAEFRRVLHEIQDPISLFGNDSNFVFSSAKNMPLFPKKDPISRGFCHKRA